MDRTPPHRVALEVIDIPRPCPADWDAMRGDERVRFCRHCSLHVYNLSAMTREAAERLVAEREGRVCVRLYRRADGTVITADCGGGWKLAAKRAGRFAKTATAVVLSAVLAPLGLWRVAQGSPTNSNNASIPRLELPPPGAEELKGKPAPQVMGRIRAEPIAIMGDIAPVPLIGSPAPLPATRPAPLVSPSPSTQPAALGSTTQPAE